MNAGSILTYLTSVNPQNDIETEWNVCAFVWIIDWNVGLKGDYLMLRVSVEIICNIR